MEIYKIHGRLTDEITGEIAHNKNLISLDIELENAYMDMDQLKYILTHNKNISTLDISNNNIDKYVLDGLVDGMTRNEYMSILNMSSTSLSYQNSAALSHVISYSKSLKNLILDDNHLDDRGLRLLSTSIYKSKLEHVSLKNIGITEHSIKYISNIIKHNNTIRYLDVRSRFMGCYIEFRHLKPLRYNHTITTLLTNRLVVIDDQIKTIIEFNRLYQAHVIKDIFKNILYFDVIFNIVGFVSLLDDLWMKLNLNTTPEQILNNKENYCKFINFINKSDIRSN